MVVVLEGEGSEELEGSLGASDDVGGFIFRGRKDAGGEAEGLGP